MNTFPIFAFSVPEGDSGRPFATLPVAGERERDSVEVGRGRIPGGLEGLSVGLGEEEAEDRLVDLTSNDPGRSRIGLSCVLRTGDTGRSRRRFCHACEAEGESSGTSGLTFEGTDLGRGPCEKEETRLGESATGASAKLLVPPLLLLEGTLVVEMVIVDTMPAAVSSTIFKKARTLFCIELREALSFAFLRHGMSRGREISKKRPSYKRVNGRSHTLSLLSTNNKKEGETMRKIDTTLHFLTRVQIVVRLLLTYSPVQAPCCPSQVQ